MASYNSLHSGHQHSPYGEPNYSESTGFITPQRAKKSTSNWIKIGIPVAILVIAGAVVGAIFGIRASKNNNSSSQATGSSQGTGKPGVGLLATATNSQYMVPLYPTATNAAYTKPQFNPSNSAAGWPEDDFKPSNPDVLSVRPDRPRLFAPASQWAALPKLIASDPYLKAWNATIFGNATAYYSADPVKYVKDGDSGILDISREIKQRVKAFAYVFRLTKDTKWVDRTWRELQNAAGKGTQPFGDEPDRWNSAHFLDAAELAAAFGIAYDWLYDSWTTEQKAEIRDIVIKYALNFGLEAYGADPDVIGWWKDNVNGNWNCVCNGGLTIASLAILGDDTTNAASSLLGLTVENAKKNCALGPSTDGTWAETANYWYFGTTGHAEMSAALISATGSHYGLVDINPNFVKTGDYHMYAYGPTSLFDWGDHGPTKFSSTANSMIFYAKQYNRPEFALFQRDRPDAAEPWSMFWYDPTISGAYWNDLPLDRSFDDAADQWVSMRSSWTDINALFVGMKAGKNQGHQTHNDLDVGDFVLDAMGTRWAGEFGSADYLSPAYFLSQAQEADRWKYYRKMTAGQNTILINQANQLVGAAPVIEKSESTGTKQGSSPVLELAKDDTAFWIADMTSAYANTTSIKRGVRLLNGRRQVLIQDEINTAGSVQWRMHTNATITIDAPNAATLVRDGKTMKVSLLSPATGAEFTQLAAKRFDTDPPPPAPDQDNTPVTVLAISVPAGTYNIQVLFNPQWEDSPQFVTPPSVDLAAWSLTSHNS